MDFEDFKEVLSSKNLDDTVLKFVSSLHKKALEERTYEALDDFKVSIEFFQRCGYVLPYDIEEVEKQVHAYQSSEQESVLNQYGI